MKSQIVRFLVVGGISTLVNYLVFLTVIHFDRSFYLFASCSGYLSGVLVGFVANKNWTFEAGDGNDKYLVKYIMIYTLSLLLSLGVLQVLVGTLGVWPELANIITIGISTVTNFVGTKLYVFRK